MIAYLTCSGPAPPGRASGARRRRRAGPRRLAPVVGAIAVVLLAAGCTPPGGPATSTGGVQGRTAPPASDDTVATGVYYVTDTRVGFRLAREMHDVDAADPVTAAVEQMISGPTDPDYSTTWDPATDVLDVGHQGEAIVVNLSVEARTADVGSEGAALMIQQLVYTVTGAAEDDVPVLLLVDDEVAGELWGAVTWDDPVNRADPLDVRMLVQMDEPREGAESGSPLTVRGDAAAFEANVPWRVVDHSGFQVAEGSATTSEGQTFAPYEFTVALDPGTYTVEISEDDPSDGAGGPPMTDTRTVTID